MPAKLTHPEVISDLLLQRFSRLLGVASVPVIRLCEGQFGITRREWRVMASLQPKVSMLSSELAEKAELDRARTSRAISSLVTKGLLKRQHVSNDQRKVIVTLTDKGCRMYETFFPLVTAINSRLLQGLSPETLHTLDTAISHIQSVAEKVQNLDDLPKANRRRGGAK